MSTPGVGQEVADQAANPGAGVITPYSGASAAEQTASALSGGEGSQAGQAAPDSTVPPLPADLGNRTLPSVGRGTPIPAGAQRQTVPSAKAQPQLETLNALVNLFDFLSGAQTISTAAAAQQVVPQAGPLTSQQYRRDAAADRLSREGGGTYSPISGTADLQMAQGYESVPDDVLLKLAQDARIADPQAFVSMWQSGQLTSQVVQQIRPALDKELQASFKGFGVNLNIGTTAGLSREALQNALFTQMPATERAQLEQDGYQVPGNTLGDFLAGVASKATASIMPGQQGLTGIAQTQTAGEAYTQFEKDWTTDAVVPNSGGKTFQEVWGAELGNAGLVDTDKPNETEALTAFQTVLSDSVAKNQTIDQTVSALTAASSPPGEAQAGEVGEIGDYIRGVARSYGVNLTSGQFNNIVSTAQQAGWTETNNSLEIQRLVASDYTYDPNNNAPSYATVIKNTIQNIAGQYQIPLSQQSIGQYVTNVIKGTAQSGGQPFTTSYDAQNEATSAFTQQAKQEAIGLYPTLAPGITAGSTVQQLFQPYADLAQQLLGTDASNVSLINNPAYARVLANSNEQGGKQEPMSLDQAKTYFMQNPAFGFQHTQAAMDLASNLADALGQTFGKTAAPQNFSYSNAVPGSAYGG